MDRFKLCIAGGLCAFLFLCFCVPDADGQSKNKKKSAAAKKSAPVFRPPSEPFALDAEPDVRPGNGVFLKLDRDETQDDNNGCGPSSAARVVRYYKQALTYKDAYCEVAPCSWGATPGSLVRIMRNHGLSDAHEEDRTDFGRVMQLLDQGRPLVTLIDGGGYSLHYIAVQGYDRSNQRVFFTDTNGGLYAYSFREFDRLWDWSFGFLGIGKGPFEARGLHPRTILTTGAPPPPPPPPPQRQIREGRNY